MECEPLNNNPSFGIKQQMTTAAPENDHSKSTNQLTIEQQQLEPQVCCFSDGLDSDYIQMMILMVIVIFSLRSSLFRFLLAGESESQGEVARTHGAKERKEGSGREALRDDPNNGCGGDYPSPRATPACLKGNGKDCYAGYVICVILDLENKFFV